MEKEREETRLCYTTPQTFQHSAIIFKEYITLKAKDSFKPDLDAEGKSSYNLKECNKTDK